jgi:hypothetical protein
MFRSRLWPEIWPKLAWAGRYAQKVAHFSRARKHSGAVLYLIVSPCKAAIPPQQLWESPGLHDACQAVALRA